MYIGHLYKISVTILTSYPAIWTHILPFLQTSLQAEATSQEVQVCTDNDKRQVGKGKADKIKCHFAI